VRGVASPRACGERARAHLPVPVLGSWTCARGKRGELYVRARALTSAAAATQSSTTAQTSRSAARAAVQSLLPVKRSSSHTPNGTHSACGTPKAPRAAVRY
jgi:hypothetical protein